MRIAAVLFGFSLALASAQTQQAQRKISTLSGTVEQVNPTTKKLSVANDPIPGGMGAMTMSYSVDKEDVLSRVKPGDRISATVFEGDLTLYDVQLLAPTAAVAAPPPLPGMTLEDLEKMALSANPTLQQAQANARVAAGQARQAGLYPNPTAGYYGDEIRGGYSNGGKQGGFISQTIVTGGKLAAARRVAGLLTQRADTLGEVQRQRILNNVRSLYYQVLADQRRVDVRQSLAQLSVDATQTAHQLANVGQADQPDVLQAEIEQQQNNVSLRVALHKLESSWRTLAAVVGKPNLPSAHLAGDLEATPDLNYEEWLATTLRESPEIQLAGQAVERAEGALAQAKKASIPDLQVYANLSQNNSPLMETSPRATGLQGGVQIGVQLPIFNRNQGGIAAAEGEIESAKLELERMKLQIARETANLFRDYDSSRETARLYKVEMLPRARKAYEMYKANYRNMSAAYPQALISQRTLFQLEADYVQALDTVWQTALSIRGFGLMDALSSPSAPH